MEHPVDQPPKISKCQAAVKTLKVAGMTNRSAQLFGIYANISAWGHEHIKPDAYSATIMQVSNESRRPTFPSLYNDNKLHFFAQWTTDRDWRTGCYNMDCPGFVPFRNTRADMPIPGMVVDAVSSYGGADSSMVLQIVKDGRPGVGNGDWWLYRVSGPVRFPLGHWPAALFTSLSRHATVAAWYGAVGFPPRARDEPLPAMGSGRGPGEGYARAAYLADIRLMDDMANPVDASMAYVMPLANAEGCYKVAMEDTNGPPYTFFYGGPVSHAC
ncbi:hypothetical protein U9M48_009893 [Paspalum notatum var. saurae]|uniref:Neprosin PEP catalytic domain-containing protein n=1 Tax=Paspalum notatum var. saurae TaxID=547442 RepID=A0AAQ3SSJ4_PASNO